MRIAATPAFGDRAGNPYTALLYDEVTDRGHVVYDAGAGPVAPDTDVWHVHWPEVHMQHRRFVGQLLRTTRFVTRLWQARRRGVRLVWTVHDLQPHSSRHRWLDGLLYAAFVRTLHGCIYLSQDSQRRAVERHRHLRRLPRVVTPHGHYRDAYPDPPTRAAARESLQVPEDLLLVGHVGRIRSYKGAPELVRAFGSVSTPVGLLLAGEPRPQTLGNELQALAQGDDRIDLRFTDLDDEALVAAVRALDLVVLPYRAILNSGSALMALSLDRPVLVPNLGSMRELQRLVGEQWLYLYEPPLAAKDLEVAISSAQGVRGRRCLALEELRWANIASDTIAFYERLLDPAMDPG